MSEQKVEMERKVCHCGLEHCIGPNKLLPEYVCAHQKPLYDSISRLTEERDQFRTQYIRGEIAFMDCRDARLAAESEVQRLTEERDTATVQVESALTRILQWHDRARVAEMALEKAEGRIGLLRVELDEERARTAAEAESQRLTKELEQMEELLQDASNEEDMPRWFTKRASAWLESAWLSRNRKEPS